MSERRKCDRCGRDVAVSAVVVERHRDDAGAWCLWRRPEGAQNGFVLWSVIRAVREHRGLSTYHLAALMGVSQPAVVRLETGKEGVSEKVLLRVAQALGVSIRDLLLEGLAAGDAKG